jgi:hypothetical protein
MVISGLPLLSPLPASLPAAPLLAPLLFPLPASPEPEEELPLHCTSSTTTSASRTNSPEPQEELPLHWAKVQPDAQS